MMLKNGPWQWIFLPPMDLSIKALRLSGRIDQSNESFLHPKKKDYKEIINLRYSKKNKN
jgi:hypothetical protein